MRVSVVIPTYNCARYLPDAVRSVLEQTEPPHELIIIDDGSTDDTPGVLEPWRDRLRYVRQANQGVAVARNTGLRQASGDCVAFLDADDAWYPGKLALQLAVLRALPNVMAVCCDFGLANATGAITRDRHIRFKYRLFDAYGLDWPAIFANLLSLPVPNDAYAAPVDVYYGRVFESLFLGNFVNTSSLVLRREVIDAVGAFTEGRRTQEDYEYWLKVAMRGDFAFIDWPLLLFREREFQLTAPTQRLRIAQDTLDVVDGVLDEARHRVDARLLSRRLADRCSALALALLGARDAVAARRVLRRAIGHTPLSPRLIGIYGWSFLPSGVSESLRSIVRRHAGVVCF